jgi:hypothetical protein
MNYADLIKLKCNPDKMKVTMGKTGFLSGLPPLRQRLWHIDNEIYSIPVCKTCKTSPVKWTAGQSKYRLFCCGKCSKQDPTVREKTEKTCLDKYGFKTNLQSTESKEKSKKSLMDRLGVDNAFKAEIVKAKCRKTNLEKYGYENAAHSDIVKNKADATNFEKYGRKRYSQNHIPLDVITLKNDPDKMRKLFLIDKMPITEIAELLDVSHSQLCIHFRDNLGIDITRHQVSRPERRLREYVESLDSDTRHSDRKIIAPKELDIVLDKQKIAIELHGLAWHGESRGKDAYYHINKMKACAAAGYRLIQITDHEYTNIDLVHSRLSGILGKNKRIYARHCEVRSVAKSEADPFLRENHIQGWCVSSIQCGLYYKNELIALMTFGKSRFDKNAQWELLRFANAKFINVVGGASKLFKYFTRHYFPSTVISYCDLRWNTGVVYEKMEFVLVKTTGPNFWYTKNGRAENRMKYQKHRQPKLLKTFDSTKTGEENMRIAGYDRFWDCGSKVFMWTAVDIKSNA